MAVFSNSYAGVIGVFFAVDRVLVLDIVGDVDLRVPLHLCIYKTVSLDALTTINSLPTLGVSVHDKHFREAPNQSADEAPDGKDQQHPADIVLRV